VLVADQITGLAGGLHRGHGARWGGCGGLAAGRGWVHRAAAEVADGFHPRGAVQVQSLKDRGHCRGDAASFAVHDLTARPVEQHELVAQ